MRKLGLLLALLLIFSSAHAEASLVEKMSSNKALTKFSRGLTNIVMAPGEFVTQVPPAMEQSPDYLTGFFMGLGRGIGYTLLRAGAGIYDVATFPFPGGTDYGPIIKPETNVNKVGDWSVN